MKKRILHLIATNFLGGPEKQIIQHLKRLDRRRFTPMVASFLERGNPNEFLVKAADEHIDWRAIPMYGPVDIRSQWELSRIIRRDKIDLLCVHGYKSSVMGWFAAKANQVPILAFSRGYTAENIKILFYQWLERRLLGRMDGLIAVSSAQKNRLQKEFNIKPKRMWVVHNSISLNGASPETFSVEERDAVLKNLNLPVSSKIVVTAGRLSPEKGHRHLVEAIGKMKIMNDDTYFVFCGEGMCELELKQCADSIGVGKKIIFAGFRRDIERIYRTMEFMVLPSLSEGLPNVVLESFAAKKPVVATCVGGVPEIVEDGINGFLCPPADSQKLAEAMQTAFKRKESLAEMGLAGYKKVLREFSAEAQTKALGDIYEQILTDM